MSISKVQIYQNQVIICHVLKIFEVKIKKEKIEGVAPIDAVEKVVHQPKEQSHKLLRMPVGGVYKIKHVKGQEFSLQMHRKNVAEAVCDNNVGVDVKSSSKDNVSRVGDVMWKIQNLIQNHQKFTALVCVQEPF